MDWVQACRRLIAASGFFLSMKEGLFMNEDTVEYVGVKDNETNMRFAELKARHRELDMHGADILREILNNPPISMNDDCKAIFTYEIFTLASGHDYLELLSQFHAISNKDNL